MVELKGGVAEVLSVALEVGVTVAGVDVVEVEVVVTALEVTGTALEEGVVIRADVALEVVVIALDVGDVVAKIEVVVGVGLGGNGGDVQDTPAASLSKQ